MKDKFIHLIFLVCLLSAMVWNLKCTKDEIQKHEPKQESGITEFYSDQFSDLEGKRDGVQLAFSFPVSQVDFNPFTATQTAYNITKIDSVRYDRIDILQAYFYAGVTWGKYHRQIQFDNLVALDIVFAPINGNTYYVFPNIANNQMDNANPNYTVTLIRQSKSEPYFDHRCGKNKKRFWYTIITGDVSTQSTIDGDRCSSNLFAYKLII